MHICRGSIGPVLASAIPQTSLSRVDCSPKCLLLLLMTKSWMRRLLAGRSQLPCLCWPTSYSFFSLHFLSGPQLWMHRCTQIVGLAAPSEACIWIPLRKAGGATTGWQGVCRGSAASTLITDGCAWPSPVKRPTPRPGGDQKVIQSPVPSAGLMLLRANRTPGSSL